LFDEFEPVATQSTQPADRLACALTSFDISSSASNVIQASRREAAVRLVRLLGERTLIGIPALGSFFRDRFLRLSLAARIDIQRTAAQGEISFQGAAREPGEYH
jgi:hypothetical protein